jgi:uncharacterized protein (TIGR02996 family)
MLFSREYFLDFGPKGRPTLARPGRAWDRRPQTIRLAPKERTDIRAVERSFGACEITPESQALPGLANTGRPFGAKSVERKTTHDCFQWRRNARPARIFRTMSDTERSLLDAVLENPDDDLPRLVYADFLEEHEDSTRAEFIRAQISISRETAKNAYDSDEYISANRSLAVVTNNDLISQLTMNGITIKSIDTWHLDSIADMIRLRDHETCIQFRFVRGFVRQIIAPISWTLEHINSILLFPFTEVHFQPHLTANDRLTFQKSISGKWSFAISGKFRGNQTYEISQPEYDTRLESHYHFHDWFQNTMYQIADQNRFGFTRQELTDLGFGNTMFSPSSTGTSS